MDYVSQIKELARKKLPDFFIRQHVKYVVRHALELCNHYKEADKLVVELAAWSHDIIHPIAGYDGNDHHVPSSELARNYLTSLGLDNKKVKKVVHCVKAHRTSRPPEPRTIEAKIVASADNLSHFSNFDFLVRRKGLDWAYAKIKRDLDSDFMLPEALEEAEDILEGIKARYDLD